MKRTDVYQTVTDKIIAVLESGARPWICPFKDGHRPMDMPLRHTRVPYQGINILLLWIASMEKGYTSNIWMTVKQANELGAKVKKGEKGHRVVFAKTVVKEVENNGNTEEKVIPFMRSYTVFNTDQIENLPEGYLPTREIYDNANDAIPRSEEFFDAIGANVKTSDKGAYFSPASDYINMPGMNRFENSQSYYSTLAHEHIHWTGHKSRLDRETIQSHKKEEYAKEELIAELGAAYLCADLGLPSQIEDDHGPYIQSWLKALKNDKRYVFWAASRAQEAVNYLHETAQGSAQKKSVSNV